MNAVKLEGGQRMSSRAKAIRDAGIPVMGHIGKHIDTFFLFIVVLFRDC